MQPNDPYGAQAGFPEQQNPYETEQWEQPRRTSIAAILGLISSLIFCLPVITQVLGLLFGIVGIISVATSEGRRKGTGLSIAAIILSTLILVGWGMAGIGGYRFGKKIADVPVTYFEHIFNGEYGKARTMMDASIRESVSDQNFAAFREDLESKYGTFLSGEWDYTWHPVTVQAQAGRSQQYQDIAPWCVKLHFTNQTIYAIALLEPQRQAQQQPASFQDLFLIRKVTIMRPDQTFQDFPAASNTTGPANPIATPESDSSLTNSGDQDDKQNGGG